MDIIQCIFDGFSNFMYEKSILHSSSEIIISYVPFAYDLIDNDLDFDETYYTDHLLVNFDKMLNMEIINAFNNDVTIKKIILHKGKMLFRNKNVHLLTRTYMREHSNLNIITKEFCTLKNC